jgi:hypothetical protein
MLHAFALGRRLARRRAGGRGAQPGRARPRRCTRPRWTPAALRSVRADGSAPVRRALDKVRRGWTPRCKAAPSAEATTRRWTRSRGLASTALQTSDGSAMEAHFAEAPHERQRRAVAAGFYFDDAAASCGWPNALRCPLGARMDGHVRPAPAGCHAGAVHPQPDSRALPAQAALRGCRARPPCSPPRCARRYFYRDMLGLPERRGLARRGVALQSRAARGARGQRSISTRLPDRAVRCSPSPT